MEANYLHTSYSETESSESEDNYINMEVDSFFQNNNNMFMMMSHSATINKEFEFQSFSSSSDKDQTTTSPADELFYMGRILPLHLPPRLEALHKILQIPKKSPKKDQKQENEEEEEEEDFGFSSTPLYSTPTANTPFQSCNISPSESCHVSRELNPAEYFADYLSELQQDEKSWTTERVTKPTKLNSSSSSFGSKLKWAYLKSLFTTSGCAAADQRQFQNVKHFSNGVSKKTDKSHRHVPFGQIKSKKISSKKDNVNNLVEDHHHNHNNNHNHKKGSGHRRSFSGVFKRISKTTSTSTISSTNRHVWKSSSEVHDNSIQAAIAHCKRSSQKEEELQIAKQRAFCSISASYI